MPLPRLALSVIGDEIGSSLDEMISFAHEHGLTRLDMRTVGGRNLLGMTTDEVIDISRTLEKAGIHCPAFVSPMFKWPAPGKDVAPGAVDFAFDPAQCPSDDVIAHAMQIAVILGAPHLRIFSFLRYQGFRAEDVGRFHDELARLLALGCHYDVALQLENEPVCNVGSIAELAAYFHALAIPLEDEPDQDALGNPFDPLLQEDYLRPLVDIGNAYAIGERPSDADIAFLAPRVSAIHLKDRDLKAGRAVPLGDGDVPWPAELARLLAGVKDREVLASLETHCPQDRRAATARSLAGFRRIAAEIGAEVV